MPTPDQEVSKRPLPRVVPLSSLKHDKAHRFEEQFRAIFELASVGIVQVDPSDGKFIRCNEKYCQITGYTWQELSKLKFMDLTHPDDRHKDWENFKKAVRGEIPTHLNEKRYIRKDGSVIWVRINAAFSRDEKDAAVRTVEICEDITERKQAEEKLKETYEDVSRFNNMAVDREMRMIELKKEINELCRNSGLPPRYPMDSIEDDPSPETD